MSTWESDIKKASELLERLAPDITKDIEDDTVSSIYITINCSPDMATSIDVSKTYLVGDKK